MIWKNQVYIERKTLWLLFMNNAHLQGDSLLLMTNFSRVPHTQLTDPGWVKDWFYTGVT